MKSFFTFTPHAEKLSITDLADLFAEPPCYEEFVQPVNHFLVGAKGSGKSSLLRAVSAPVAIERESFKNISFLGFYIPFSSSEGDFFKENYKCTMSTDLFELYFCLKALVNILECLGQINQLQVIGEDFTRDVLQKYGARSQKHNSSDAIMMLREQSQSLLTKLAQEPALLMSEWLDAAPHDLRMPSAETVLSNSCEYLNRKGLPIPCLLIDGYDFFADEMRLSTQAMARKEFPFCVKIAGRYIYDIPHHASMARCEWNRDIEVLSLDHEVSTKIYRELCIKAADRILSKRGMDKRCEEMFGMQVDHNDNDLFGGADIFIRLSSGNLKRFLDLCRSASRFKETAFNFDDRPIVPFSKQHAAAKNFARNLFLDELPSDVRDCFKELRSFIFWALDMVRQFPTSKQTLNFRLRGNIKEPVASILRKGFIYRYLICSNADFRRLNLTPEYLPLKFSVNSAFAPKFDFLPDSDNIYDLEAPAIEDFMIKATPYDPEFEPRGRRRRITKPGQRGLFQEVSQETSPVFISHPLSLKGEAQNLNKKRITLLKKTIASLMKDEIPSLPRIEQVREKKYSIAARELPTESAPDFRDKVERRINEAPYTIYDITVPAMGVFFELGLAAAFKTPYFLFRHLDHVSEDKFVYPNKLSGLDVKKYSKEEDGSFRKWFELTFHELSRSLPVKSKCRYHSFANDCTRTNIIKEKTKQLLYLAISPGNTEVCEFITNLANNEYDMVIAEDWPAMSQLDAHCSICAPIQACSCAIGLCDPGDYINAVALGMLQGLRKNFVLLNNRAQPKIRPLAMSREKIIEYSPSTLKKDIEKGVRNFLYAMKGQE